jgi:hypothetical protein
VGAEPLRRRDFSLSLEQRELRDAFAGLFEKGSPPTRVRAAEPGGFDAELWRTLTGAGTVTMGRRRGAVARREWGTDVTPRRGRGRRRGGGDRAPPGRHRSLSVVALEDGRRVVHRENLRLIEGLVPFLVARVVTRRI